MNSFAVWIQLIRRDAYILKSSFYKSLLESTIFLTIAYILYGVLLPYMGLKPAMIAPLFWGMLVLMTIQESYDCARAFVTDLALNPAFSFYRILPLPLSWFLARYVMSNFLQILVHSLILFMGGELLFGPQQVHSVAARVMIFVGTYCTMILFFATFSLMIGTAAPISWFRDNMWSRVLIPFVFGGCLYVSWFSTYAVAPLLALLFLLSPFTYVVEGLRAAVLGQEGYLPLPLCIGVMLLLSTLQCVASWRWFIQRIDPVVENKS